MYQAVLFDLDGTLIDSGEGITSSVRYALNRLNIKDYDSRILYKFIGPSLNYSFKEYFGMDEKMVLQAVEFYRENYSAKGMYQNVIYDGMEDTLIKLTDRNITMMVATAKPSFFAEKIIKYMNLNKYFKAVEGNDLDKVKVTKEQIIKACLDRLPPNYNAVMVGDSRFDISAANDLGIDSIAVSYGYGDMDEIEKENPTHIISSPIELLTII